MAPFRTAAAALADVSAVALAGLLAAVLAVVLLPGGAVAAVPTPRPEYAGTGVPELTLAAAPPQVATGRSTTLTGRLTDPATGQGLPAVRVGVEVLGRDGSWVEIATAVTDGAGWVSTVQIPSSTTGYRLHAGEAGSGTDVVSPVVQVPVRTLTAIFDRPAVRVGREVAVHGVLAADGGSELRLQERRGGAWHGADLTTTAADGSYTFSVTTTRPGFSRWRVVRAAGPTWPRTVALLPRLDAFRLHTYSVTTRGDVLTGLAGFRDVVAATYADPRGWLRAHHRFREVGADRHSDFSVVLAQARMLPRFSSTCSAAYSCRVGRYVVINNKRWRHGSPDFPGDLPTYRQMLVNHETGHWLGLGHRYCPRPGAPAPVMQQQSKGMQGCRVNAWPLAREVRAVP